MPDATHPWSDHGRLTAAMASWRLWSGRELFRVAAGADWVRLHLVGDERPGLLLTGMPGAQLVLAIRGGLPKAFREHLSPRRDHPLGKLLAGGSVTRLGLLPEDRVAAFELRDAGGRTVYLLHQLFGARGNTSVVDETGKVLWARHRPPHTLLCAPPPEATWSTGGDGEPGEDLSTAALDHLARVMAGQRGKGAAGILTRRLKSTRKLVDNLAADLAVADRGDAFRDMAETLGANLHDLAMGSEAVQLPSCRTGKILDIVLDPALKPAANMEAYFRRARKADRGREIIADRLEQAREQVAEVAAARDALTLLVAEPPRRTAIDQLQAVTDWCRENDDLLRAGDHRRRARVHSPDEPGRPFRRYRLADRWEVWIGRNNRENDELTHRAAHSRDLWLHAQGVPGSHVILRTAGHPERIPRAVLEQAAALAALHSKAKHSALVPVIYTEQRYVRKPRKSPPGTAVCIQEKSLFAAPGIPEGATTI